ncbi:homocysteine biosynthesis protein [Moorella sulfitireducens]|uniref:homocysteine biosynthesis protein n=1 Tax=Neomoorella sulfitireducens TaxID=2972948 RepID=UPI0021ABB342
MAVEKSLAEINARIKSGKVVVLTAEEVIPLVREKGVRQAAAEVDVVTTGTFGTMCSSGAYFNFGHTKPRMKMSKVWLNNVQAYAGLAAVDAFLGATEVPDNDPLNSIHPGEFRYGGGHVIHDLVARKPVSLRAIAYGTDCYPRREINTVITIDDLNQAVLFNPRNAYQNYNVAVNLSDRTIYTYMGVLKPHMGNANYSTSGQLSPLLKDPYFRTIGIGTRIFLGGGTGYVVWQGTQHCPGLTPLPEGGQLVSGGTLAVIGDLKQMRPEWLVGVSFLGYGASLTVGLGIPIPILNEEIMYWASRSDEEIYAPVVDYGLDYPAGNPQPLGYVTYAQLKSGTINLQGREVPTAPLSSYPRARQIAAILKDWIRAGGFLLSEPVALLPSINEVTPLKSLQEKEA